MSGNPLGAEALDLLFREARSYNSWSDAPVSEADLRAVDVAVRRLREKIEDDPAQPEYIVTKRGAGYYFGKIRSR